MRIAVREHRAVRIASVDGGKKVPDANVAVQLKLQAAFGLRVEESFLLRPAEAVRDDGLLGVTRGTKGGRDRLVPIELKLAVLEEAARLANPFTGSTIPNGRTKQQWKERYYKVLKKHGVTQAGIGVISHGLRFCSGAGQADGRTGRSRSAQGCDAASR